jgi:hypothetical protein
MRVPLLIASAVFTALLDSFVFGVDDLSGTIFVILTMFIGVLIDIGWREAAFTERMAWAAFAMAAMFSVDVTLGLMRVGTQMFSDRFWSEVSFQMFALRCALAVAGLGLATLIRIVLKNGPARRPPKSK